MAGTAGRLVCLEPGGGGTFARAPCPSRADAWPRKIKRRAEPRPFAVVKPSRRFRLLQSLDADPRQTLKIGDRAINHVDPVDTAFPTFEVEGTRPFPLPDEMPHGNVVGITICVDDLQVQHFHIGTAHVQANRLETPLTAP